jgi:peptidoglycan/xylan/chitin deacetylase (PgdA/CDA1 family)
LIVPSTIKARLGAFIFVLALSGAWGALVQARCWAEPAGTVSTPEKRITPPDRRQPPPPDTTMLRQATYAELPLQWRNSIRRVQTRDNQKLLAFTFDLCEGAHQKAGYDTQIVRLLQESRVRATFFASGKWMRSHPEATMQLMADPLFEIGNHGWVHENFRLLSKTDAEERFLRTQAQYQHLRQQLQSRDCPHSTCREIKDIPLLPELFRFPFGVCNSAALDMLAHYGVAAIQWDVVPGDSAKGQTAEGITQIVLKRSKPGSIVVFHANGRGHGTAEALPGLLATLKDHGFEFVTVSQLLRAGTPVSATDCYELKPGDNARYDNYK